MKADSMGNADSGAVKANSAAKADFGMIGLGVMGQNLVLNLVDHGITVVAFDPWPEARERFFGGVVAREQTRAQREGQAHEQTQEQGQGQGQWQKEARGCAAILRANSINELVSSLQRPRRVMLMVKAGAPVDALLEQLTRVLESGDIIIDGGNSHFRDTQRRAEMLTAKGLHYLGVGVSGGEAGARYGPSLMAGGHSDAWRAVEPILNAIAARAEEVDGGKPCCGLLGPDGAGHFVKMVHNGIEYADMELIAEAYAVMRVAPGMGPEELSRVFYEWNQGDLNSYLIGITAEILDKQDHDTGRPMVDVVLDQAGQKGTGLWTVQEALALGVAVPTIAAAVFARNISSDRAARIATAARFGAEAGARVGAGAGVGVGAEIGAEAGTGSAAIAVNEIREALFASKICAYAQGLAMIRKAAAEYRWDTPLGEVAMVWQGGCIIRAHFLNLIKEAYDRRPDLENLILDPYFAAAIDEAQQSWRKVIAGAELAGIPVPAFSSALAYFDSYRCAHGPANLLQAQRDYFGAHTYERVDRPGVFHTDWHVTGKTVQSSRVDEK